MKQFTMKAMGLLAMLLAFGWVQGQNAGTPTNDPTTEWSNSPSGYDAAKSDWVGTHPAEYEAMNAATGTTTEAANTPWGDDANKESWIAANPRAYAELMTPSADRRIHLTKDEFRAFPAEKQAAILKDANFIIEE